MVSGLDARHKQLGRRLTRLYAELGYGSRRDMLAAWGFEPAGGAKGGRPDTLDPDGLVEELLRRYEGRPRPGGLKELAGDNPDLAGRLKSLQNRARRLFGCSAAEMLSARGVLGVQRASAHPAPDGPARRGRPAGGEHAAASALRAVEELAELMRDVPEGERPRTFDGLCDAYPQYAPALRAGRARSAFSVRSLRQRGVLAPAKGGDAGKGKRGGGGVMALPAPELERLYLAAGGEALVAPGAGGGALRPGVVGVDLSAGVELREATLVFVGDAEEVAVGDELVASYAAGRGGGMIPSAEIRLRPAGAGRCRPVLVAVRKGFEDFVAREASPVGTALSDGVSDVVQSVERVGGAVVTRVRHRFLSPLSRETLLFALRALGLPEIESTDSASHGPQ